jgi:hypothetical protein
MALGIASPMFAAETKVKSSSSAKTSSDGGDTNMDKVVEGSLVVTRAGGVGAALVLGTPVAIVRDTYKDYTTWTPSLADHIGGHDFAPSVALVSLVTVPTSIVWGTVTGTFHGAHNGLTLGFTEPFNPASFSSV